MTATELLAEVDIRTTSKHQHWTGDYKIMCSDALLCRALAAALRATIKERDEAARLVDDMAAVVNRLNNGWHVVHGPGDYEGWIRADGPYKDREEPMSPGEVAALHHARQQEETCPTCNGDGFIEADEGDPVFDPDDRCADCPTCGGSGEVAALHHARQQEGP